MQIRKFIAAAALAAASMLVFSTAMADDFSAGTLFEPMETIELVTCPDLAYCGVTADVVSVVPIDLANVQMSESRTNCSDRPAWMAVQQLDGSIHAERLPACNSRRYDPGWRPS